MNISTFVPDMNLTGRQRIWQTIKLRWPWILFTISCALYANTIGHDYALDDSIVIVDNVHVAKGIAGIPDIFRYDSFHGFFQRESVLVSGGRYRPLSIASFALEQSLHGGAPWVTHLINVLLYGLLCLVLLLHDQTPTRP